MPIAMLLALLASLDTPPTKVRIHNHLSTAAVVFVDDVLLAEIPARAVRDCELAPAGPAIDPKRPARPDTRRVTVTSVAKNAEVLANGLPVDWTVTDVVAIYVGELGPLHGVAPERAEPRKDLGKEPAKEAGSTGAAIGRSFAQRAKSVIKDARPTFDAMILPDSALARPLNGRTVRGVTLGCGIGGSFGAVNALGMRFVHVPAQTVTHDPGGKAKALGLPGKQTVIPAAFFIAVTELTEAHANTVCTGRDGMARSMLPIADIDWHDATALASALGTTTSTRLSLPTSAEWEAACQAGQGAAFSPPFDDPALVMWHSKNSQQVRHPVAQLLPNARGIYDMHGNVREWCQGIPSETQPLNGGSVIWTWDWCRCGEIDHAAKTRSDAFTGVRLIWRP